MQSDSHPKILIVDDDPPICTFLEEILTIEGYECRSANSGQEGLDILEEDNFSLMIADVDMPGMSGIMLLRAALKDHQGLAVVMVSGMNDRQLAIGTLETGAYGYLIKPFEASEVCINVASALRFRKLTKECRRYQEELEELVLERTAKLQAAEQEVRLSREETIQCLSRAAEFRDDDTANHTIRMSNYCSLLALKAGIPADHCERIRMASLLHDMGKIATPDEILFKPGKLTSEEHETIEQHSEVGRRIFAESSSELLKLAAIIAWTHHEKFDGNGYPQGLAGDVIPIEGRIAAICDVFDALTSDRAYDSAMPMEEALSIIRDERGKYFDPELLDLFIESIDEVLAIKEEFADR